MFLILIFKLAASFRPVFALQNTLRFPPGSSPWFPAEESRRDEINHRAAREREEHRRVTVLADGRQKDCAMVVETA